ncbi:iron-containing alcohol dehydrogenase [Egibacter rhizosphaerae]|uniref:iron-containing alcohol dehydrogenase n=1 Tax=Egibacter rhizosphaerae TaxID=1670831 RepID=UPI00197AB854|nr:iron-containing alcohol dehydrogenase [Egibacter rhizosphaerae]
MRFDFVAPRRIAFGAGRVAELGAAAATMGSRALLVTGSRPERVKVAAEQLDAAGVAYDTWSVSGEPTVEVAEQGTAHAREAGVDLVVSVGGGSVLDTGKAIAGLAGASGPARRYLEVVGDAQPLDGTPLPQIAVPTTAGTGSEATKNAVLGVPERGVKVSLRDPAMVPALALVDPELTRGVPPTVTAASGLDALTQLIEPFTSHLATPTTDALCRDGIPRAARALPRAHRDGDDLDARSEMALASLYGGLALANAKLGAVHGFAGPLGGLRPAPHGAVCGRLLPVATAVNVRALQERDPDGRALLRYREVGALLTGDPDATVEDAVEWLRALVESLDVPGLAEYGVTEEDLPAVVEAAGRSSSMQGNPIELTVDERREILARAR